MSEKEALLRDMARHPDLFGEALCRQMWRDADRLQAARLAAL